MGTDLTQPVYRVDYRFAWNDEWAELQQAKVYKFTNGAMPRGSSARIIVRYGTILYQGDPLYTVAGKIDYKDHFVRIVQITDAEDPEDPPVETPVWYGYVAADVSDVKPSASTVAPIDVVLECVGLEYLLNYPRVLSSVAEIDPSGATSPFPATQTIGRSIAFNDSGRWGLGRSGNRSATKVHDTGSTTTYAFAEAQAGAAEAASMWTYENIAEYLLATQTNSYGAAGISFGLTGQTQLLSAFSPPKLDLTGMNMREAMEKVIDRRRGAGWRIAVDPETEAVSVDVFSLFGTGATINSVSIPANANQRTLPSDGAATDGWWEIDRVIVKGDASARFDRVEVLGNYIRSMNTFSVSGGSLAAGWSSADETAYQDAEPHERTQDDYRHVYAHLHVSQGVSLGGANPVVNNDGTLSFLSEAPIRRWGQRFEPQIPIPLAGSEAAGRPEMREPLVIFTDTDTSAYLVSDQLEVAGKTPVQVRPLEHVWGIELRGQGANHSLARTHFTLVSDVEPELNYATAQVTASFQTDQRIRYVETINDPQTSFRTLTIEMPDAECWVIADGTVLGVDSGGSLITQSGDEVLRTDVPALAAAAQLARAWYGTPRANVEARYRGLQTAMDVGHYITTLDNAGFGETVAGVVSSIEVDAENLTTTIKIGYSELDIRQLTRRIPPRYTPLTPKPTPSLKLASMGANA